MDRLYDGEGVGTTVKSLVPLPNGGLVAAGNMFRKDANGGTTVDAYVAGIDSSAGRVRWVWRASPNPVAPWGCRCAAML